MNRALVLLSGGIDSTTCAAIAFEEHDVVQGVSFVYGQKHDKEVLAAKAVAKHYDMKHEIIQLPNVFKGSGSSLIDVDKPSLECSYDEITGVSPTYVPFRNGILTSYAAAIALTQKCAFIYFGAHSEDAANWA